MNTSVIVIEVKDDFEIGELPLEGSCEVIVSSSNAT